MSLLHIAPRIDPTAFTAPSTIIRGNVIIGPQSSVWFGAVIRVDVERIVVGAWASIQDGAVLHADEGEPCVIGDGVTVGHGAVLHGCTVIGTRTVVLDRAVIGRGSIVQRPLPWKKGAGHRGGRRRGNGRCHRSTGVPGHGYSGQDSANSN